MKIGTVVVHANVHILLSVYLIACYQSLVIVIGDGNPDAYYV